jgi:hypothetical protein
VSFVNAPGLPDPTIEFATERDQIRPVIAGTSLPVGEPRAEERRAAERRAAERRAGEPPQDGADVGAGAAARAGAAR